MILFDSYITELNIATTTVLDASFQWSLPYEMGGGMLYNPQKKPLKF